MRNAWLYDRYNRLFAHRIDSWLRGGPIWLICIISLLQPNIMHRPLLWQRRRGRFEGCVRGTASGVEATAVGVAAAADGELAFVFFLGGLLLPPFCGTVAARVEHCHKYDGQHYHASLQNNEWDLFVGKFALKAVS